MRRVLVVGGCGAGKSTVAREIGRRTGLPVVHLDAHYWHPCWVATPAEQWPGVVESLAAGERWVIDGNYAGTLAPRMAAADTVVFLDFGRVLRVYRVLRRYLGSLGRTRPDMAPGCPEKMDVEFLSWTWNFAARSRPAVMQHLQAAGNRVVVHHFTSPRQVRRFLESLGSMAASKTA